jgi:hypothetical protein
LGVYHSGNEPEASPFLFRLREVSKSTLLHSEKPHLTADLLELELQLNNTPKPGAPAV